MARGGKVTSMLEKLGEDSITFIDSILSQEEAKDVISMMVMADEGDGTFHLPSFCTSTQMGGGNPQIRPRSPSLSPLSFAFPSDAINDCKVRTGSNKRLVTETAAGTNTLNLKNSFMHSSRINDATEKKHTSSTLADPGTELVAKNRFSILAQLEDEGHDADPALGGGVTESVSMDGNVATGGDTLRDVTGRNNNGRLDGNDVATHNEGYGTREGDDKSSSQKSATPNASPSTTAGPKGPQISSFDEMTDKMGVVDQLLSRLDGKTTTLATSVKDLEASLEFSQHEIDLLKRENADLKRKLESVVLEDRRTQFQTTSLEDKLDRLETQVKKRNLIVEGLPEVEGGKEDVEKSISNLLDQMALDRSINIEACFRMGPPSRSTRARPRSILVIFERMADRDLIYSKRTELRHAAAEYQRVWLNEDLGQISQRKRNLIKLISKEAQLQGIDCRNGKYALHVDKVKYDCSSLDSLPPLLHPTHLKQIQIDEKTLAYQSEHAPFSNFYPCQIRFGKHQFFCAEQAFQFLRAKTLNRDLAATRIYLSRDVRFIKQAGEELGTSETWDARQYDVMYGCIKKKFEQNPDLKALLLNSGDLELVEATPNTHWGCGATLSSNVLRRHNWSGRNNHGEILMTVREELRLPCI